MKVNFDKICYGCFEERGDNKICPHCGYNSEEEKPYLALPPGTLLNGKYMIGKVLGIGGFGITYVGFDLQLQMKVAIKEYMPTGLATRHSDGFTVVLTRKVVKEYEAGMESFLEEARILAKLQNTPNIVNVQNFFKENCTAYIVMEYIEGVSFKEYLKQKGGKVPYEDAMRILRPIMSALTEVHKFKLLHRDISPDNITITPAGDSKLLDFGAARFASSDDKSISVILKHGYAPEEQYSTHGKQGAWTDVYAMGATLYRAITGVLPPESVERRYNDTIKKPSAMGAEIPINSENAIMKALSINAEDRFQTMKDFMTELDRKITPEKEPVFSSLTAYNTSHTPPDDNATTVGGRTVADKSPTPTEEDKSAPADSSSAANKAAETKKMLIVGIVGALCIIGIIIGIVVSATAKENKNSSTNSYTTEAATEDATATETDTDTIHTYATDYFPAEYSSGYFYPSTEVTAGSGLSTGTTMPLSWETSFTYNNINYSGTVSTTLSVSSNLTNYYASNTSKQDDIYIDAYNFMVYDGEYYDVRMYAWLSETDEADGAVWSFCYNPSNTTMFNDYIYCGGYYSDTSDIIDDGNGSVGPETVGAMTGVTMEFHFYKAGTLATSNPEEVEVKGITQHLDLDLNEGFTADSSSNVWLDADTTIVYNSTYGAYLGTAEDESLGDVDANGNIITDSTTANDATTMWEAFTGSASDPYSITFYTNEGRLSSLPYLGSEINYTLVNNGQNDLPASISAPTDTYAANYSYYNVIDGDNIAYYTFSGWFTDRSLTIPADTTITVDTSDITLYGTYYSEDIEWLTYTYNSGSTFKYPSDSGIQWDDGNFYLYDGLISGTSFTKSRSAYYPLYDMDDLLAVIDNTDVQENLINSACDYLSLQNCSQNEDISYFLTKDWGKGILLSVYTKNENGITVRCDIYISPLSSESPYGVGCHAVTVDSDSYKTYKLIYDKILNSYDSSSAVPTKYDVISSSKARVKVLCLGSDLQECSYDIVEREVNGETVNNYDESGGLSATATVVTISELAFSDSNGNSIVWCRYIPNCTAEDQYSQYEYSKFGTYGGLTWYEIIKVDDVTLNGTVAGYYNRCFTEYDGGVMYVDYVILDNDEDWTNSSKSVAEQILDTIRPYTES